MLSVRGQHAMVDEEHRPGEYTENSYELAKRTHKVCAPPLSARDVYVIHNPDLFSWDYRDRVSMLCYRTPKDILDLQRTELTRARPSPQLRYESPRPVSVSNQVGT